MTNKHILSKRFVPLTALIKEDLKDPSFRKAFSEERNRLALAAQIRMLRERKHLTQKEVAQRADMPQSVVARLESGAHSVSVRTLNKIARVFARRIQLV